MVGHVDFNRYISLIGRELIYMLSISIEMLFKEKKKIMSLMLSLIATFVVCIVFIQFFSNPYLIKMTSISHKIAYGSNYILPLDVVNFSDNFAVMTLSIALLIICIFLISYSCYYYCLTSSVELGFLKMAGYNTFHILCYKAIQMLVITIVSLLISVILSFIFVPLVLLIINIYTKSNIPLFNFSIKSYLFLLGIVLFIFVLLIAFETKYVISTNISGLLKTNNMNGYKVDNRSLKIPDVVFLIAYCVGLFAMYVGKELDLGFVIASCVGALGAYGMFYYWVPNTILELFDDVEIEAKKYVVLGNVSMFMQQSRTLIILIMISVIIFPSLILFADSRPFLSIALHIAFVLTNILLATSLINRFQIDNHEKKGSYNNLMKIGLSKSEVTNISTQQVNVFYIIFWIFTLIYILCIFIAFFIRGKLNIVLGLKVLLEYTVPYLLSQLIIYQYKRRDTSWQSSK